MRILVVEDDKEISNFIKKGFEEYGYSVECVENGEDGLELALNENFSLIIVDIMLPGRIDGYELIKRLREKDKKIPIIILSAKKSVQDKVKGLLNGSDDYLTKPFSFEELYARVLAILRRASLEEKALELHCNGLKLDLIKRVAYRDGKEIFLKPKEFNLLEYLLRNKNRIVTRTMILEHIWDFNFDPQTNVVDVLVHRLRNKIDKGLDKKLIFTVRGMGYIIKCDENI
jgi:two-component system OmpR family response regulator